MPPKRRASTRVLSAQDVAKKPRVDEESDDEPAWRKIKVEDLDFDASYVGNYEPPTPPTPSKLPKRKRWTHYGDEPLIKTEDLPHGWTSDERVLDPQCARLLDTVTCHQNPMPFTLKNDMTLSIRFPGALTHELMTFIDDTGSDIMTLWQSDLEDLDVFYQQQGLNIPVLALRRTLTIDTISGMQEQHGLYSIEVAFPEGQGNMLTTWDLVDVLVIQDPIGAPTPPRVNGPWLRHKLHTSTSPDGNGTMKIFRTKSALARDTHKGIPVGQRIIQNRP